MSFWEVLWFIVISFAFIAYLMVLFSIVSDIFRNAHSPGWVKAAWIVCLIFFPLVTAVIYLLFYGRTMNERQLQAVESAKRHQDDYIRSITGSTAAGGASPTEQIVQAKTLLDTGAITQHEFESLKAKVLA